MRKALSLMLFVLLAACGGGGDDPAGDQLELDATAGPTFEQTTAIAMYCAVREPTNPDCIRRKMEEAGLITQP